MIDPPTIRQLSKAKRYEVLLEIPHDETAERLRPYMAEGSWIVALYWLLGLAALVLLITLVVRSAAGLLVAASLACAGMVGAWIVLLPVHESLHAVVYRILGARDVKVVYQLARLAAFCIADRAVVGGRRFLLITIAPVVVLNALLVGGVAMTAGIPRIVLAGALLLHLGACSGDLALVQFLWIHRASQVWTWDDHETGITHFVRARERDA